LKEGDKLTLSDQRKEYLYDYQKSKLKRIPLDVQKRNMKKSKLLPIMPGNL